MLIDVNFPELSLLTKMLTSFKPKTVLLGKMFLSERKQIGVMCIVKCCPRTELHCYVAPRHEQEQMNGLAKVYGLWRCAMFTVCEPPARRR